ncbi:hypothetical protein [Tunturiibacter gelidiferens]|uniref:hypothetical protein n=1 Tax=Tunturiibacter gelidiferens TaxID=3069689 RepID=UPI003D9B36F8
MTEPALGECFSLDWKLPVMVADARSAQIEVKAQQLRKYLLTYRGQRLKGETSSPVYYAFEELVTKVLALCVEGRDGERVEVSFLTYNQRKRRLEVVDAALNGGSPPPNSWNFWLSFGLGLAGAAF